MSSHCEKKQKTKQNEIVLVTRPVVKQDELMELHGFDDSPEKESSAEHNIKQRITMEKGMKASDLEIELQQQAANQLGHRQAAQDQIDEEKDAIVKSMLFTQI